MTTAAIATFGAEIDDVVGGLDHIEVVLDHNDGVALINQLLQHVEQFPRVLEVQTGRGLVQNVDCATRTPA
mgnify:CR=1 FL=1